MSLPSLLAADAVHTATPHHLQDATVVQSPPPARRRRPSPSVVVMWVCAAVCVLIAGQFALESDTEDYSLVTCKFGLVNAKTYADSSDVLSRAIEENGPSCHRILTEPRP